MEKINEIWFDLTENEKFEFIEDNINIITAKGKIIPLKLADFQKQWLLAGPLFSDYSKKTDFENRIALKSRNIGASYVMIAMEATLSAWIYPNIFIPFVASKEEQANDLIKHCKNVIKYASFDIPLAIRIDKQPQSELRFANGTKIKAFQTNNPGGIRGPRALFTYLDEFAFVNRPQEVLSAVQYFTSEGGQTNILSTVYGKQNLFWTIWSDKKNYSTWKRFYVPLFKKMSSFNVGESIISQVSSGELELNIPWLSIDFVEKKRKEDAGFNYVNFLQEMCGIPIDEVTAAIPEGLLDMNARDYYFIDKRPILSNGPDRSYKFVISADFGAARNMTALVVFSAEEGRLIVCNTLSIKGNFNDQINNIREFVSLYGPDIFIGDSSGLGGISFMDQLKSVLEVGTILGVSYSKKDFAQRAGVDMSNKEFMVNRMLSLLSEGLVIVPKNFRGLREEILGLQKLVFENNIKYTGKKGPVGHDDLAMAWLQGALVFDMIYTYDTYDNMALANNIFYGREYKKYKSHMRKMVPKGNAVFVEGVGARTNKISKIKGFDKLI